MLFHCMILSFKMITNSRHGAENLYIYTFTIVNQFHTKSAVLLNVTMITNVILIDFFTTMKHKKIITIDN